MFRPSVVVWILGLLLLGTVGATAALSQQPKLNPKYLGVDVIKTKQRTLYGFVLGHDDQGNWICAVDRSWLANTYPDFADEVAQREQAHREIARSLKHTRIEAWIAERSAEKYTRLRLFLESELERLDRMQAATVSSVFVKLAIAPAEMIRVTPAKAEQRHIAGVAYQHELPDVTLTSTVLLERKLTEMRIDPRQESFDLTDKLPKLSEESQRQWAARQALVEHTLLNGLELQGAGATLLPADGVANPLDMLKQFSSAGESALLEELAKELKLDLGHATDSPTTATQSAAELDDWQKAAVDMAERQQIRGVLVFQLNQDLLGGTVRVTSSFLAKGENGAWFSVYLQNHADDGGAATDEQMNRLKQDPNVSKLLSLVKALGGEAQVEKALRQGAATSAALNSAKQAFHEFQRSFTNDLSSSPIPLGKDGR